MKNVNNNEINLRSKTTFLGLLKQKLRSHRTIYLFLDKVRMPLMKLKFRKIYTWHFQKLMSDLQESKGKKKILFTGVPVHSNLGDQAQYLCIKKWIQNNYKDYAIIEIPDSIIQNNYKNTIGLLKENVSNTDIFVFQSGYGTTDICNVYGEYAHRKILNNFKNKVIVFPQTVNFKLEREKHKSAKAYKSNNNYVFMARDEISYKFALSMYDKRKILLYPDIVTTLIGNYSKLSKFKKEGILFCLRNDDEKLYTDLEYEKLINNLKTITEKIDITDTYSNKNFEFDKSECETELQNKLNQFASYKLIITDRYHGTIFSLITNTPVIVLNSTDHKLSSGVHWFKGVYDDLAHYCDNLEDVYKLAKNIYNQKSLEISNAYFKEKYYDKLYKEINIILK